MDWSNLISNSMGSGMYSGDELAMKGPGLDPGSPPPSFGSMMSGLLSRVHAGVSIGTPGVNATANFGGGNSQMNDLVKRILAQRQGGNPARTYSPVATNGEVHSPVYRAPSSYDAGSAVRGVSTPGSYFA